MAIREVGLFPGVRLARLLVEAGRLDEAERVIRGALLLDPASAEAHFDLCVVQITGGRLEEAAQSFEEAFRLDPGNENVANNLLGVNLELGRVARALEVWRRMKAGGLRLDPALDTRMRAMAPDDP